MKWYHLYFSPTGGTKKVGSFLIRRMVSCFGEQNCAEQVDVDILKFIAEAEKGMSFENDDICLVSVPSFAGRVPVPVRAWLKELKGNGAKAILNVVYGNRAIDDTLLELRDLLTEVGLCCVAGMETVAEHSIFRQFGAGRPDLEDQKELDEMAKKVASLLEEDVISGHLKVPGNRPYKELKKGSMIPIGTEDCTGCGICAESCPVHAIPIENPELVNRDLCFACMHCTAICPSGARAVPKELLESFLPHMEQVCAGRKENRLYTDRT